MDHGAVVADVFGTAEIRGGPSNHRAHGLGGRGIGAPRQRYARSPVACLDERAVLVHSDVHECNALESGDNFKLIDPDELLAQAEYDFRILMREDPLELLDGDPHERARWLAHRYGLDPTAICERAVFECVPTGLLCAKVDLQPVGRRMLAAVDHVAQ